MSLWLSALTCVLALRSLEVAASTVYLPVPAFMLERGNSGNGNGPSSTTTSTTTSSTSSNGKKESSTTNSSNTHISSSSTSRSSSTITQPSSTLTTQSSSTSTSTPTPAGTVTSSSSGDAISSSSSSSPAPNNAYGSTSAASQGLSTAARTGLAFGIMFFLILSAMLVCYLRRRSRIAREKAFDRPAPLSSEVSQHHPPAPGAPRELSALPPTRLNPAYTNISRSRHSANSSISPLLSESSRASHPASAWNRYSTFSQESDTRPIIVEDIPPLPNPHDPPSASARTISRASTTPANPYDASVLASAATTRSFSAPVGSSSISRGAPVLNAPHRFDSVSEAARTRAR